jgi:L-lactate dehydrogenase complex protein LldG
VLSAVRAALATRIERAPRPEFTAAESLAHGRLGPEGLLVDFLRHFVAAGGEHASTPGALARLLAGNGARAGWCDPALQDLVAGPLRGAGLAVYTACSRDELARMDFSVSRATAAIAETGSLVLTDHDTPDRLAAVAPWIHVAVLDPATIRAGLADMLRDLPADPNAVFVTGPSQTADVEGILIRGVHGPGVQVCLVHAQESPP